MDKKTVYTVTNIDELDSIFLRHPEAKKDKSALDLKSFFLKKLKGENPLFPLSYKFEFSEENNTIRSFE